jgi:hypothetical protein
MSDDMKGYIQGRLPDDWFVESPEIEVDRDEILVIGRLQAPDVEGGEDAQVAAAEGRIKRWREDTRAQRMEIAREAERRFERKLSWGARCGDAGILFTHLSSPVMTRLRLKERRVLDTLVDSGVARSRSEALAWCVRLVADNETEWLEGLKDALGHVEQARNKGPAGRKTA